MNFLVATLSVTTSHLSLAARFGNPAPRDEPAAAKRRRNSAEPIGVEDWGGRKGMEGWMNIFPWCGSVWLMSYPGPDLVVVVASLGRFLF